MDTTTTGSSGSTRRSPEQDQRGSPRQSPSAADSAYAKSSEGRESQQSSILSPQKPGSAPPEPTEQKPVKVATDTESPRTSRTLSPDIQHLNVESCPSTTKPYKASEFSSFTHSIASSSSEEIHVLTKTDPLVAYIASNIVKVFSNKNSQSYDFLRALADMSDEKSSTRERTAFFTSCMVAIDTEYKTLTREQKSIFISRVKSKQVQALRIVLEGEHADLNPKTEWLRNLLRSNLAVLDNKFMGGNPYDKANTKNIVQARKTINEFIKHKDSQINQFNGHLESSQISITKDNLEEYEQERKLTPETLRTANIAIRTNDGTKFLIDPNLSQSMPDEDLWKAALANLIPVCTGEEIEQIKYFFNDGIFLLTERQLSARDVEVLSLCESERVNAEFVIDVTCDDGLLRITAKQELRLTAGPLPYSNEISSLNPHQSYYKSQTTVTIGSEINLIESVSYSYRTIPMDKNFNHEKPATVNLGDDFRSEFARREKILESSGRLWKLNDRNLGNQDECDELLHQILNNTKEDLTKHDGFNRLGIILEQKERAKDLLSMETVSIPDVNSLWEAHSILNDFKKERKFDLETANAMSAAAVKIRDLQLRLYTVLQTAKLDETPLYHSEQDLASSDSIENELLTPKRSYAKEHSLTSSLSSEPDYSPWHHHQANILRLNAAIMSEAGLIAEQLENGIADLREMMPSANLINSTLEAAWHSREEFAYKQSFAMLGTLVDLNSEIPSDDKLTNLMQGLIAQAAEFFSQASSALNPETLNKAKFGTGLAKKKNLNKATSELTKLLASNKPLPTQYKEMSISQLMMVYAQQQASEYGLSDKETKNFIKKLNRAYSIEFQKQAAENWEDIEHNFIDSFLDINAQRRTLGVTLKIIPKRHGEGQLAVGSNARAQTHTCNLARTTAVNTKTGHELFVGVRHGILDAYDISKNGADLKLLSLEERQELLASTRVDCAKILETKWSVNRSRYQKAINKDEHKFYFGTRAGRNILRRAASLNMAKELVQEAVLTSAVDQEEIKNRFGDHLLDANDQQGPQDKVPLPIDLDSISLVTPDILRQAKHLFQGKTHKTERNHLANQVRAFKDLNRFYPEGVPVTVKAGEEGEQEIEGRVKPTIKTMNFGVNKGELIKFPAQGLMGWWRSDALNKASLEKLGCFYDKKTKAWGEAQQVTKFVLDEYGRSETSEQKDAQDTHRKNSARISRDCSKIPKEIPDLTEEKKARIRAVINNNPNFRADPALYTRAINNLSVYIYNVYVSKAHRNHGSDPYQTPAKIAQLSYLLGNNTTFNCKSGKDRSGQLDAEIKSLATQTSFGHVPRHNHELSTEDKERKALYALKSGNLELQQYNTGLRGYKLFGVKPLIRSTKL